MPRPVIIFDGQCPFCQKQIARIRARDPRNIFEYTPRQTPGLDQRFPILTQGDFNTGMRLIRPDGTIAVGADAVYEIARQLPAYRAAAWLYRVPVLKQIFRGLYAWVAKNRYKLAEKSGQVCDPLNRSNCN
jgi:predicted DCC family thiol-disulfide oxidoreductase YuxK